MKGLNVIILWIFFTWLKRIKFCGSFHQIFKFLPGENGRGVIKIIINKWLCISWNEINCHFLMGLSCNFTENLQLCWRITWDVSSHESIYPSIQTLLLSPAPTIYLSLYSLMHSSTHCRTTQTETSSKCWVIISE